MSEPSPQSPNLILSLSLAASIIFFVIGVVVLYSVCSSLVREGAFLFLAAAIFSVEAPASAMPWGPTVGWPPHRSAAHQRTSIHDGKLWAAEGLYRKDSLDWRSLFLSTKICHEMKKSRNRTVVLCGHPSIV
jgi:hypothetical protein